LQLIDHIGRRGLHEIDLLLTKGAVDLAIHTATGIDDQPDLHLWAGLHGEIRADLDRRIIHGRRRHGELRITWHYFKTGRHGGHALLSYTTWHSRAHRHAPWRATARPRRTWR